MPASISSVAVRGPTYSSPVVLPTSSSAGSFSPSAGTPAAIGFARRSGIPYNEGLIKNRYVGRTFIQPDQTLREHGIRTKFNPLDEVAGQRVVIVDDSIVRGTTTRKLVGMLFESGAKVVHVRVSSPPIVSPCFYGIDMADLEAQATEVRVVGDRVYVDTVVTVDGERLGDDEDTDDTEYWIREGGQWVATDTDAEPCSVETES